MRFVVLPWWVAFAASPCVFIGLDVHADGHRYIGGVLVWTGLYLMAMVRKDEGAK